MGRTAVQHLLQTRTFWLGATSLLLATITYLALPPDCPEPARRTAFIFVLAALFWALEIIPLYATSLLVVLLEVFLLGRPGGVLEMDRSGYQEFLVPFSSPVVILFFGGFTLAAALHKFAIDRVVARRILSWFGRSPFCLLAGFISTTAVLSMWLSNTATTAMMIVMIRPLIDQLDRDDPYRTGLVLSIPVGANVGGIATPVGTPPNAIALGILSEQGIHLNFVSWMAMAVPLATLILLIATVIIYLVYPSRFAQVELNISDRDHVGTKAKGVSVIATITVLLWLTSGLHQIPEALVALLAAGLLAMFGFLSKDDFKNIDWDILILMWGGLALGKGMEIGGLADWIVSLPIFGTHGFALFVVVCVVALALSTFVSNTATANLLIPLVISIPDESQIMLAIAVALSCSFAMALPVSTPPNALAFSTGTIRSKDMIRIGVPISVFSVILVLLGFKFVINVVFQMPGSADPL